MLHRVPKGVILALGLYGLLLGACLFAPELMESYLLPLFELPLFSVLFFGLVIPNSLIAGGGPFMLCVFLFCFVPAFLLRWHIPAQAKHFTKCWPVICFLLGISYHLGAWNWLECDWYIPFYLWMLPALAGLAIGKLAQQRD